MINICEHCGREFAGKSHKPGKMRKYCGVECYKEARGCKTYSTAVCLNCGKPFRESRDRPNTFCSSKCSGKYYGRIKTIETAERKDVNPKHIERLKELRKEIKEIQYIIDHERRCTECGKWFMPAGTGRRLYCSEECARKADNRRHDKRLYKNGKADMTITLTKLYMRDGGVCQICGKHIDFDRDSNSDDYPSIDHIKPLSKGGLHVWDNVQLACRRCNALKGDKWDG